MIPTTEQITALLTASEDSEYYAELNYWDETLGSAVVDLVAQASSAGLFGKDVDVSFWVVDETDSVGGLLTVDVGGYSGVRYASRYNEFRDLMDDTEATGFEMLTSVLYQLGKLAESIVPKVSVLHQRDPDSHCDLTVYVGDQPMPHDECDIDPGAGYQRSDWNERIRSYADDTTNFGRAAHDALLQNADSGYITGDDDDEEHPDGDGCAIYDGSVLVENPIGLKQTFISDLVEGDVFRDTPDSEWWQVTEIVRKGDEYHIELEVPDEDWNHILDLAELPHNMPRDTPNVLVTAGHNRVIADPDTFGPFETAQHAFEWVLEQYESGEMDQHGCWVSYSVPRTPRKA